MTVKCIDSKNTNGITEGKEYSVIKARAGLFEVKNDNGELSPYDKMRFALVDTVANNPQPKTSAKSKKSEKSEKNKSSEPESDKKQTGLTINQSSEKIEVINKEQISKRLETVTKNIRKEVGGVVKSFCKIGYELYKVREEKLYLAQDFKNVSEYAEKVFSFQKSSVANYISICERFSVQKDGKPTAQLKPEFSSFSYGQLSLMLSLPAEKLPEITPDKTCGEIREIKKQEKVKSELKGSKPTTSKSSASSKSSSVSKKNQKTVSASSSTSVPNSNLTLYNVAWLYKGNPFKNASIQLSSEESMHKEILVLLKNDWYDFGRDGDSLTINLVSEVKRGDSK